MAQPGPAEASLSPARPRRSQDKLLARVRAAEQTLRAIPLRDVDALVLSSPRGTQVVTLKGGESAYRMLVEAMSEGAATVSNSGELLYCNRRFAELIDASPTKALGLTLQALVCPDDRARLEAMLRVAPKRDTKSEFVLRAVTGREVPVQLSFSVLRGFRRKALGIVVTDLTDHRRRKEAELKEAESVHRLLLERELVAQENERRRIARELHDEAGQLLTSLLVTLRSMQDARTIAGCKTLGKRMREVTAQAIDEIGRLARGLHPIALDDHGLVAALSRYVAEYSKTHSIKVRVSLNGLESLTLPPPAQIALYRILQETLTNVARHARARNVEVAFKQLARQLEMSVSDDGRGFDASAALAGPSSHLGLRSIRERVLLLGGTATFTSSPKGTQVRMLIPLAASARPPKG